MIELVNTDQLAKATKRARASNLLVQPTSLFRQYRVTNRDNGNQYVVNFFVRNGKRYAGCTCKGGSAGYACKHIAAAAGLHVCIAAQKGAA